jgi:nitrite reductase/ring-hydroxylating ferredoxin subunit
MALIPICRTDEVPQDAPLCRSVPEVGRIAVARLAQPEGAFAVFENRCPHVDGPLGAGKLSGNTIACPWHFFRFDLTTGTPVGTESIMRLRLFPTTVANGNVSIEA